MSPDGVPIKLPKTHEGNIKTFIFKTGSTKICKEQLDNSQCGFREKVTRKALFCYF